MWEYLDTGANDVFGRAQVTRQISQGQSVLLGVEADRFDYAGDREHYSNINVDDTADGFPPFPNNASTRLGPWLDFIDGHPITNVAPYAQYANRGLFSSHLSLTLGARYDHTAFDYEDVYTTGRPTHAKKFERLSPRIAVVLLPRDDLSVKLLAGRAFRAPAPTELAGAHTFSLASNITNLKPEVITTGEVAVDWKAGRFLSLRADGFLTKFENEIAYSAQNANLSTNIYTLKTAGVELEALFSRGEVSGYANWSWAHRLDEQILDNTIAASPHQLTWDPAHKLNLGASWTHRAFTLAADGHLQGAVQRRATDIGLQPLPLNTSISLNMDLYRPTTLGAWFTLDGRAAWQIRPSVTVETSATNVLDTKSNQLVKVLAFPFDYQQEGIRWLVSVRLTH
jgi:iron complex outermembrane receptor protein